MQVGVLGWWGHLSLVLEWEQDKLSLCRHAGMDVELLEALMAHGDRGDGDGTYPGRVSAAG